MLEKYAAKGVGTYIVAVFHLTGIEYDENSMRAFRIRDKMRETKREEKGREGKGKNLDSLSSS